MTDSGGSSPERGRLLLVTGANAQQRRLLGAALARRLSRAVLVDGPALERLVRVEAEVPWDDPPSSDQLRDRFLRWSAALVVAETYQLEGYDAVLVEEVLGDRLEDLLDLIDPEPVHVVILREGVDPATPHWGLWVEAAELPDAVAEMVLGHLEEALVLTADPT
jgi:hypothetical protein